MLDPLIDRALDAVVRGLDVPPVGDGPEPEAVVTALVRRLGEDADPWLRLLGADARVVRWATVPSRATSPRAGPQQWFRTLAPPAPLRATGPSPVDEPTPADEDRAQRLREHVRRRLATRRDELLLQLVGAVEGTAPPYPAPQAWRRAAAALAALPLENPSGADTTVRSVVDEALRHTPRPGEDMTETPDQDGPEQKEEKQQEQRAAKKTARSGRTPRTPDQAVKATTDAEPESSGEPQDDDRTKDDRTKEGSRTDTEPELVEEGDRLRREQDEALREEAIRDLGARAAVAVASGMTNLFARWSGGPRRQGRAYGPGGSGGPGGAAGPGGPGGPGGPVPAAGAAAPGGSPFSRLRGPVAGAAGVLAAQRSKQHLEDRRRRGGGSLKSYGRVDWLRDSVDIEDRPLYRTLAAPGLGDVEELTRIVRALAHHAFFGVLLVEAADLARERFLRGGLRGAADRDDVRRALYAWRPEGPWVRGQVVRMAARYLNVQGGDLDPAWRRLAGEVDRREPDPRETARSARALVRAVDRRLTDADQLVVRDVARRVARAQRLLLMLGDGNAWEGLEVAVGDDLRPYEDAYLRYESVVELLEELPRCLGSR